MPEQQAYIIIFFLHHTVPAKMEHFATYPNINCWAYEPGKRFPISPFARFSWGCIDASGGECPETLGGEIGSSTTSLQAA